MESPEDLIEPFLGLRPNGFISDYEYLVDIGAILLWGGNCPTEIVINVADNKSALSWMDGARVLVGPASRLQLEFRIESIRRHIHAHGVYLRSKHNASGDFPTRGSEEEIHSRDPHRVTTRRSLCEIWPQFAPANSPSWNSLPVVRIVYIFLCRIRRCSRNGTQKHTLYAKSV